MIVGSLFDQKKQNVQTGTSSGVIKPLISSSSPVLQKTTSQPTQQEVSVSQPKKITEKANNFIASLKLDQINLKKIGESFVAGAKMLPSQIKQGAGIITQGLVSQQKAVDNFYQKLPKAVKPLVSYTPVFSSSAIKEKSPDFVKKNIEQAETKTAEYGAKLREKGFQESKQKKEEYAKTYQPSEGIQKYLEMISFNLPQVVTSVGLTTGTALVTKNPALATVVGLSTSYGMGASEVYDEARSNGLSDRDSLPLAQFGGFIIGALDFIPLERFIKKTGATKVIEKSIIKKISQSLVSLGIQSGFEGITEGTQEIVGNAIASTYKENQDLFEGVKESVIVGALLGGMSDLTLDAVTGLTGKSAENIQTKVSEAINTPKKERTGEQEKIVQAVFTQELTSDQLINYVTENKLSDTEEGKTLVKTAYEAQQSNQNVKLSLSEDEKSLNAELVSKEYVAPVKEEPKVEAVKLYHGTDAEFDKFDINKSTRGNMGKGIYLTTDPKEAGFYGKNVKEVSLPENIKLYELPKATENDTPSIFEMYEKETGHPLKIDLVDYKLGFEDVVFWKNPYNDKEIQRAKDIFAKHLQNQGYEGVRNGKDVVLFNPDNVQLKPYTPIKKEPLKEKVVFETPKVLKELSKKKIENAKTIRDVSKLIKKIKTEFDNLTSEAEGKTAWVKEIREGLNTKNIAKLKRIYKKTKSFQGGDIITIRNSKHSLLIDDIVNNIKEKYPEKNDEEALDFALNLPNKSEEHIAKPEELKILKERERKLSLYLKTLQQKQESLNLQESDALIEEWRAVLASQEKLQKIIEVPRKQLPQGEGKKKVSRLEARVNKFVDKITEEQIDRLGVASYNQLNKKENIEKAVAYVSVNHDEALQVLAGQKEAPQGILHNAIYIAMEQLAQGDLNLARRLASLSSTRMGQEISILTEIDPESTVQVMRDIINVREEVFKQKFRGKTATEAKAKVVSEIQAQIKKPDRVEWNQFLNEIKC